MVEAADNISVSSGPRCRICLSNDSENSSDLITPCNCAGTIGMVHASCLEHWASVSCRMFCEICKCKYRGRRIPKYGLVTSILPYVKANWNPSRVLIFTQAVFLFLVVNMEIGNYGFTIDDPDFPKPSSMFLLWCLITFNFLVYFLSFNVANLIESWNTWRRSQFMFLLIR